MQCGLELIGDGGADADVELIWAADRFLNGLGLPFEFEVHVNTLGSHASRKAYIEELSKFLEGKKDTLTAVSRDRLERGAALRVLDSKSDQD